MTPFTKDASTQAAIHVGSASVAVGRVSLARGEKPELSHVKRTPLSAAGDESALFTAVETALSELLKDGTAVNEVSRICLFLSSPWHHAKIRTVNAAHEKASTISERTVLQAVGKYKDEAPPQSGRVDLEAVALQARVDGYPTALARPVTGTQLSINFYESEIDEGTRGKLLSMLEKHAPKAAVSLYSTPLVSAVALRSLAVETSFVVAEIGGAVSDVAVMQEDGMRYLASFPIGLNTLLKGIGGADAEEGVGDARSRLTLFARGELAPEEAGRVQEQLTEAFLPWRTEVDEILQDAASHVPIPRRLFVISEPGTAPWILKELERDTVFNLEPTAVAAPLFQAALRAGEGSLYDPLLSAAALFLNGPEERLFGEPEGAWHNPAHKTPA